MKTITAKTNDCGQRLDKFIKKAIPSLPDSLLNKYIRIKRIKVNNKRAKNSTILALGDRIDLYIPNEFVFAFQDPNLSFLMSKSRLSVLYEDDSIMLVDKEPGLVVHEDQSQTVDTLIARVKHYLYEKGEYNPSEENSFAPALCNRIDRNTGGIVIVAKDAKTLRVINQLLKKRLIIRKYLCLVHGRPDPKSGQAENYLVKDFENIKMEVFDHPTKGSKYSKLFYNTLESAGNYSLVEVELVTGRTHQIRAQLAHMGHPLVGDLKYGNKKDSPLGKFSFQALHAYQIMLQAGKEAGHLSYLNGRLFQVEMVGFIREFYQFSRKTQNN